MSARTCLRTALTSTGSGGSCWQQRRPGEPAGAQRQAERGVRLLVQTGGQLQRTSADVDHEQPPAGPAEPAADREEGQPRLVLAGEHLELDPRLVEHPGQDRLAVGRLADRAGGEGEEVLHPLVLGDRQALLGELHQRVGPGRVDVAVRLHVLREPQLDLVRRRRQRVAADVGVDDQQVHGVGSHVDDPESHGSNVATRGRRCCGGRAGPSAAGRNRAALRLEPCPRLPWTSAARGSSSPTPPTPTSATAAT